jgi:hypothetical protein
MKTKIFVSNLGKTLLLLLFLSPGARKFLILTKISQEIQIFAKAFRGLSFIAYFSFNKICTTLLVFARNFCKGLFSQKCEDENFRFKPRQDSPSPTFSVSGCAKFLMLKKNSTRNSDFCEIFQRNKFL